MDTRRWSVGAALLLTLAGCGGDDEGASKDEITGMWYATKVEYVNRNGPDVVELISEGCVATLELGEDNSFHYACTPPEGEATEVSGTWELTGDVGDVMRVTPEGATWYFAFDVEFSGSTLKLTNGGAEYDFNGDEVMEEARWNLALSRQAP